MKYGGGEKNQEMEGDEPKGEWLAGLQNVFFFFFFKFSKVVFLLFLFKTHLDLNSYDF